LWTLCIREFLNMIYWACCTTQSSTTCRNSNYVHFSWSFVSHGCWALCCNVSKSFDSTNALNCFWYLTMRSCLVVGQLLIAVLGHLVEHWCLRSETGCDPWFGLHGRSYTSLPHSGETDAGMPSSSRAQSTRLYKRVVIAKGVAVWIILNTQLKSKEKFCPQCDMLIAAGLIVEGKNNGPTMSNRHRHVANE
jgi:hypothetical protein